MSTEETTIDRILAEIDRDELVQLVISLTELDSPTGCEKEIATFILNWFEENEFLPVKQVIEDERFNAIGILRGSENGPSLTLNGHLDTTMTMQPKGSVYIKDDKIHGKEVANMKAGLAAIMLSARAINRAGVRLKGDLIVATVAGEISVAPTGTFQETQDRGEGIGTRHLLANGIWSDYAIVADGSEYTIVRAQPGVAYFRITVKGDENYTPFVQRPENISDNPNAIIKMTKVIDTVEEWAKEYEQKAIRKFPWGRMEPKAIITEIEGGMPRIIPGGWREPLHASQTPPSCEIHLDVRVPPDMNPIMVKHDLENLLRKLPFNLEIEMFRSQMGYEGKGLGTDYLHSTLENCYERVFQAKSPAAPVGVSSMWTDTNLYWEVGIPAIKWGPCEIIKYPDRRTAEIDGYLKATKVYSLVALEICGEDKK